MTRTDIETSTLTPYEDVNEILSFFTRSTVPVLRNKLAGIYLTGSLSYEAFNYHSSDIDLIVIVRNSLSVSELDAIRNVHGQMEQRFQKWARRLECSYTPIHMLKEVLPPKQPRPWYSGNEGVLYSDAPYGNEWIINNYLLYHHAITLFGPDFKQLVYPIDIAEVQKACVRDLFTEWEPKKTNQDWFSSSYHQSYFVLNLCRILYTVIRKSTGTKTIAASWVKNEYGQRWHDLISLAQQSQHGRELRIRDESLTFMDFVIQQVLLTDLGKELADEIQNLRQSRIMQKQ